MGSDPETIDPEEVVPRFEAVVRSGVLLCRDREIGFGPESIRFHRDRAMPAHPNALRFQADCEGACVERTFYSVGGGFVVEEGAPESGSTARVLPHPIQEASELAAYCTDHSCSIPEIVMRNELSWRREAEVRDGLLRLWHEMSACAWRGCHREGVLPGGLNVKRRAAETNRRILGGACPSPTEWIEAMSQLRSDFRTVLACVSCVALAVNEENAAFGRVVTAPTNGAAGVIPAVLAYLVAFEGGSDDSIVDFLLTAGEIGSLFKKGATVSAAMGGCQAEIGVSSAMAAAGLAQAKGGTPDQVLIAAEIAMEHHLGLTCDPVGGLVQIPCIERNSMGAVKAITAAALALEGDGTHAKVSLDHVIRTMWSTALDMNGKYKESSEGGLAVLIPVAVPEC